jgi:protein-tyrosine phosphatase
LNGAGGRIGGGVYGALKAVYKWVRHTPDRMLHRRRHREARERLLRLQTVRSILVVCHGNICRSPYLEAVLRRELPAVDVTSAGLVGPDRPVPKNSLMVTAERGLDLSTFRSRPLSRVNAREIDLVIVMDPAQARHMTRMLGVSPKRIIVAGDLDPVKARTRAIQDPWRQPLAVFRASFDRLDRCAATIFKLMPYAHNVSAEALTSRRSGSAWKGQP